MSEQIIEKLMKNSGKISGALLGLIISWIMIHYGFLRGLFVVVCVLVGFYLGSRYDSSEEPFGFGRPFSR